MNNITVTVELCAEDRARLDRIAELLTPVTVNVTEIKAAPKAAAPTEPAPAAPVAPAEEKPTENPPEAEKPAEAAPVPTDAELRALVQKLVASGKRDATRAIVTQYAAKVGDVPEDKRAECIDKLKALEV